MDYITKGDIFFFPVKTLVLTDEGLRTEVSC